MFLIGKTEWEDKSAWIPRFMGWGGECILTRGDAGSVAIHQALIHYLTGTRHCRLCARYCGRHSEETQAQYICYGRYQGGRVTDDLYISHFILFIYF